jgi:hypothetical protein
MNTKIDDFCHHCKPHLNIAQFLLNLDKAPGAEVAAEVEVHCKVYDPEEAVDADATGAEAVDATGAKEVVDGDDAADVEAIDADATGTEAVDATGAKEVDNNNDAADVKAVDADANGTEAIDATGAKEVDDDDASRHSDVVARDELVAPLTKSCCCLSVALKGSRF